MNSRPDAIRTLLDMHPNAFVVLSNGLTTREAAHFHRQDRCFYMLHAMGESLAVGIGLATARPKIEIVVIEGDYNAIMGLASWCLMPVSNLHYYVLANGLSETTGGQCLPTLPFIPDWCKIIPITAGKADTPNPPSPLDIWTKSSAWLKLYIDNKGKITL